MMKGQLGDLGDMLKFNPQLVYSIEIKLLWNHSLKRLSQREFA